MTLFYVCSAAAVFILYRVVFIIRFRVFTFIIKVSVYKHVLGIGCVWAAHFLPSIPLCSFSFHFFSFHYNVFSIGSLILSVVGSFCARFHSQTYVRVTERQSTHEDACCVWLCECECVCKEMMNEMNSEAEGIRVVCLFNDTMNGKKVKHRNERSQSKFRTSLSLSLPPLSISLLVAHCPPTAAERHPWYLPYSIAVYKRANGFTVFVVCGCVCAWCYCACK